MRDTAQALRIGYQNVRNLKKKGVIEGTYDRSNRTWWFTPEEVAKCKAYLFALKRPREGELTARLYEHFVARTPLTQIVIDLRVTPAEVLRQREIYDVGGGWITPPEEVATIREVFLAVGIAVGPDREGLIPALKRLAERDRKTARAELSG